MSVNMHRCKVLDVVVFDGKATLTVDTPAGLMDLDTADWSIRAGDEVQVLEVVSGGESDWCMGGVVKRKPALRQNPDNIARLPGETLISWADRMLTEGRLTDNKLACISPIFYQMKTLLMVADSLLEEVEPTDPEFRPESSLTERERNILYFRGMYRDTLCKP